MKLEDYKQLSINGLLFHFEYNFHSMKEKEKDRFLFAVMDRLIEVEVKINKLKLDVGA